jgi:hypothetical protein
MAAHLGWLVEAGAKELLYKYSAHNEPELLLRLIPPVLVLSFLQCV